MNFRPSKHDRPVFGKLASEYSLTYYGTVVPSESDDYLPIRGITASPEQVDDNYTTGVISSELMISILGLAIGWSELGPSAILV